MKVKDRRRDITYVRNRKRAWMKRGKDGKRK
jgi:hypothetical protein